MKMHKYFWYSTGGVILGTTIAITGFARNYYKTGNIPSIVPLEGYNEAIALTGAGIIASSGIVPLVLDLRDRRAKRKRDSDLESLSESSNEIDTGLPFTP